MKNEQQPSAIQKVEPLFPAPPEPTPFRQYEPVSLEVLRVLASEQGALEWQKRMNALETIKNEAQTQRIQSFFTTSSIAMNIFSRITGNPITSLLGLLFASPQVTGGIQKLLHGDASGWSDLSAGALTAIIGFLWKDQQQPPAPPAVQPQA